MERTGSRRPIRVAKTVYVTVYQCPVCDWAALASGKGRFKQHRKFKHGLSGPVGSFKRVVARPDASIRHCRNCDYQCLTRKQLARHLANSCQGHHHTKVRRRPLTKSTQSLRSSGRCCSVWKRRHWAVDCPGNLPKAVEGAVQGTSQMAHNEPLVDRLAALTLDGSVAMQ
jgi:transcription elongation factor Elf1